MPREVQAATVNNETAEEYEERHVHAVYERIAGHFSETRYKPWPIIASFLESIPANWIGIDSGCGNGKYLPLASGRMTGLDKSHKLLQIAQLAGGVRKEVVQANILEPVWRPGVFDYCLSIATIHHLSTRQRRLLAVTRLLQSVASDHGRILVYVWSVDQDDLSKRTVAGSVGQDVFVPWVMQNQSLNRYYHLFKEGELGQLVAEAAAELGLLVGKEQKNEMGLQIVREGWERSNYYIELRRWNTKM